MPAVFPAWVNVVDGIIAAVLPPDAIAIFFSAIKYAAYDFFIGAYPNDDKTTAVVRELEQRFPNVHLALCPHDGPTSKADCLKWIYQGMLLFEENSGVKFAAVIVHDAEDLIHPESLLTSNYYLDTYDMAQIPVLALPTPFDNLTHGVYCDDVAEFRIEDMQARASMEASSLRTASALLIPARPCSFSRTPKATVSSSRPAQSKITKKVHGISPADFCTAQPRREWHGGHTRVLLKSETRCHPPAHSLGHRRLAPNLGAQWLVGPRPAGLLVLAQPQGLFGNPLSFAANLTCVAGLVTLVQARIYGHAWGLARHQIHPALLAESSRFSPFT